MRSLSAASGVTLPDGLAIYLPGPLLGCNAPFNRRLAAYGHYQKRSGPIRDAEHESRGVDASPPGTVLRDFTIQVSIGHGGFGIVFKAERNELDQTVAIKEYLRSELAVREGETCSPAAARFVRTPRTAVDDSGDGEVLVGFDSHPCIVSCHDLL